MRWHTGIAVLSLCVLSACVAPTTQTPQADEAAVAREAQLQEMMARQAELGKPPRPRQSREVLEARMINVSRRISKAGMEMCGYLTKGNEPCIFNFEVYSHVDRAKTPFGSDPEMDAGALNAYADGDKVVVTPGMLRFTQMDDELAFVLAHELAHNIMDHPSSQRMNTIAGGILGYAIDIAAATQGVSTGGEFGSLGAKGGMLRYSIPYEQEADYVALYIMARAGYDVAQAPVFWRRMAIEEPEMIFASTTHPSSPQRFVSMQKGIEEIRHKRQNAQPLFPQIQQ